MAHPEPRLIGGLNVSVQPFMMALTVAGASSFLTPIATPANLMVMKPAGYHFSDYWKLGLRSPSSSPSSPSGTCPSSGRSDAATDRLRAFRSVHAIT